jgi:hypothetical protein
MLVQVGRHAAIRPVQAGWRDRQNGAGSIAAHPCQKRKDGAPSVEIAYADVVGGGPPAKIARAVIDPVTGIHAGIRRGGQLESMSLRRSRKSRRFRSSSYDRGDRQLPTVSR